MNDITWGREAEQWPRDYSMLSRRIQFIRFNDNLVCLTSCNGLYFNGYISKFNQKDALILASTIPKGRDRIEIRLESLSTLEEINKKTKEPLIKNINDFNEQLFPASKKDFFSICNKCFKQGIGIRIWMMDGRVIEGKTTGVNACQVGVLKTNGNHIQIMFDWVKRITSIDYLWNEHFS